MAGRTSNFQLKEITKNNGIALDEVIMKDNLKNIKKKQKLSIILNLQSSDVGYGTHWVAIWRNKNVFCYFDSFGTPAPIEVIKYAKPLTIAYSNFIVQSLGSDECGLFCIAFLHYMNNNNGDSFENYNDFINIFNHNTKTNDKQLIKYINVSKININNIINLRK